MVLKRQTNLKRKKIDRGQKKKESTFKKLTQIIWLIKKGKFQTHNFKLHTWPVTSKAVMVMVTYA